MVCVQPTAPQNSEADTTEFDPEAVDPPRQLTHNEWKPTHFRMGQPMLIPFPNLVWLNTYTTVNSQPPQRVQNLIQRGA